MITAINKFEDQRFIKNSIKPSVNYSENEKLKIFKTPQEVKQISFKGNFTKVGKNLLGDLGSNIGKKLIRIAEESADSTKVLFRKLKGKNELPYSKKAVTSNLMYNEKMQKELEEAAKKRQVVKWRWEETEKKIKNSGHDVKAGDIDQAGYPTTSGKDKINNKLHHHEDFDNNSDNLHGHKNGISFSGEDGNLEHTNVNNLDLDVNHDVIGDFGTDINKLDFDKINDLKINSIEHDLSDSPFAKDFDINPEHFMLSKENIDAIKGLDIDPEIDAHDFHIPDFDFDFDEIFASIKNLLEDFWDWLT